MSVTRYFPIVALSVALVMPGAAGAQTVASPAPGAAGGQTMASPAPGASGAPMMGGHHGRHRGHSMMRELRSLNLTDAQKQQVTAFHTQEQQANQNADAATKRANAAKMRAQIMGILTPDQKSKMMADMQRGRGHGMATPAPDAVASPAPQ